MEVSIPQMNLRHIVNRWELFMNIQIPIPLNKMVFLNDIIVTTIMEATRTM